MFLLDTNVVSEAFKPVRNPAVEAWFDATERRLLFISAITKAELLFGLAIAPSGKRKMSLANSIWRFMSQELRTEIIGFGSIESEHYAEISLMRRNLGRPISQADAQIAAIARARSFILVTRNIRDFENCGVTIVNPWDTPE